MAVPKVLREVGFHAGWILLLIIGYVVLMVFPFSTKQHVISRREAEVKQNLYAIQLEVERFAVDTEGEYPEYLIGGTPADGAGIPNTVAYTSDVLLREGYLTSYPKNPFMRQKNPRSLELQANLPSSITGNDPLRPGDPEGDLLGYRFGKDGDTMGQVLCDPRYEKWTFTDPLSGEVEQLDTWAIIEYPFWDTWNGKKHEPEFLPGMFFYKSLGPIEAYQGNENSGKPVIQPNGVNEHHSLNGDHMATFSFTPSEVNRYLLGVYGSVRTKGEDLLGDESQSGGWYKRRPTDTTEWNQAEVFEYQGPI